MIRKPTTVRGAAAFCGVVALLAAMFPFSLTGCGAGGGASLVSAISGVDVFVTDAFRDDFRQVLVTIFKVEGSTDGSNFQTLFEDATGQTINVAALSDSAVLLARASATSATFTQLRVTIGEQLTLVTPGGVSSGVPVAEGIGTATGDGKRVITAAVTTSEAGMVIVDFDLAAFQMESGRVRPAIRSGDPTAFRGRRREGRPAGTVSNLVAGASFDVQGPHGRAIHVVLTDTTTITSASGDTATLANGQRVFVEGELDRSTGTLTATSVRIDDRAPDASFQAAKGTVASVSGSSFTLAVDHAHHFAPTGGTITVVTDGTTTFRKGRVAATLADVVAGGVVMVGGTFEAATQTLTAKFVHLR